MPAQMPRAALPKAPRDKMRCAAYDKRSARQNARAVGKCTGHELSSQGPLRDRRCPSSHYLEPLLSSQATCKHHISHWHAGRETCRSRPAALARPHATHLFFPCANAAYEQACILACCWRGFHLHKFVADPQASLRGLAAALEPRKPTPAGRYRAEPRENIIASGSGSSPMYVANRSGASNQSRSSAMQAACNRQIVTWQFGVTELEFFVAQNWPQI